MKPRDLLAVLAATVWVSVSEFVRNELLLKSLWVKHYQGLGQVFPDASVNGAVWGLWSLVFSGVIFALSRRFSGLQTMILSWVTGFLMMWLVIGNLGVLPWGILPWALPLSVLEVAVAVVIVGRLGSSETRDRSI